MTTTFEFFEVGGCVRDSFLGVNSKDVDFVVVSTTTTDTPFSDLVSHLEDEGFSVWEVRSRTKDADFVLARRDVDCSGGRKATSVMAGDLLGDLARRDFTVNAMALTVNGELVDPFGGLEDLENRVLRFVGDPFQRITEDGVRVLRGFRFMLTKGLTPTTETLEALTSDTAVQALMLVAEERIGVELEKMFKFDTLGTLAVLEMLPQELKETLFRGKLRLSATMKS